MSDTFGGRRVGIDMAATPTKQDLLTDIATAAKERVMRGVVFRSLNATLQERLVSPFDSFITGTLPRNTDNLMSVITTAADQIAKAAQTKHLAVIANDPTSLRSFCPSCGRHYRYHDKNTGTCPPVPATETPQPKSRPVPQRA
jgi:hypothetical protein